MPSPLGRAPSAPRLKVELEVIIEEIRSLNQKVAKLEKVIADESSKLEGHRILARIIVFRSHWRFASEFWTPPRWASPKHSNTEM
jgi:hypothetical protein